MITHFDPAPGNCTLYGDPTLYALPVRLSFYLPVLANILAIATGLHTPYRSNKRALLAVAVAIFIRFVYNVHSGSLAFVDFTLFNLLVVFLPSGILLSGTVTADKWIVVLQLGYMVMAFQSWPYVVFTKRIHQGRQGKENCRVNMYLYKYFNLYNPRWMTAVKALGGFIEATGAPVFLGLALFVISQMIKEAARGEKRRLQKWWNEPPRGPMNMIRGRGIRESNYEKRQREKKERKEARRREREGQVQSPNKVLACLHAVLLANIVLFIEKFISGNAIVLEGWSWWDTSQLIPFIVGAGTVVSTIYGIISYKVWKWRQDRKKRKNEQVDVENTEKVEYTTHADAEQGVMERPPKSARRVSGSDRRFAVSNGAEGMSRSPHRGRYEGEMSGSTGRRVSDSGRRPSLAAPRRSESNRQSSATRGRESVRPPNYPVANSYGR